MKFKLKDLDDIDTEMLDELSFNTYEEIEVFLKNEYCGKYKDIKKEVEELSLSDTLDYMNLEIIRKKISIDYTQNPDNTINLDLFSKDDEEVVEYLTGLERDESFLLETLERINEDYDVEEAFYDYTKEEYYFKYATENYEKDEIVLEEPSCMSDVRDLILKIFPNIKFEI